MPWKMGERKRFEEQRETVAIGDIHPHKKTKYACIVETHESARKRLESTLPRNHDEHIAEQGFSSLAHHNLVHKFIPMPQAMKIPDAKAAVNKDWEKLGKITVWQLGLFPLFRLNPLPSSFWSPLLPPPKKNVSEDFFFWAPEPNFVLVLEFSPKVGI